MKPVSVTVHDTDSLYFVSGGESEYDYLLFIKVLHHAMLEHSITAKHAFVEITVHFDNDTEFGLKFPVCVGQFPGIQEFIEDLVKELRNKPEAQLAAADKSFLSKFSNIDWPEKNPT